MVQEVLAELPRDLRGALKTVQIVVQDFPKTEDLDRAGLEKGEDLYGYFDGVSLPDKLSTMQDFMPDRVVLFRRALLEDFPGPKELKREIRITLIHELGHFFGMDEEDLAERGYE